MNYTEPKTSAPGLDSVAKALLVLFHNDRTNGRVRRTLQFVNLLRQPEHAACLPQELLELARSIACDALAAEHPTTAALTDEVLR